MNSIQNNGMMNYQLGFKAKIKPENFKFVAENVRDMTKLGGLNDVPEGLKKLADEARGVRDMAKLGGLNHVPKELLEKLAKNL